MAVRSRMIHRAVRQVNTTTGTDAYGQPQAPTWVTSGDPVPCFYFSQGKKQAVSEDRIAYVEDIRILVSSKPGWTSDSWSESDRVLNIQDRQAVQIVSGPFEVESVQHMRSHYEIMLKRVGGQLSGN